MEVGLFGRADMTRVAFTSGQRGIARSLKDEGAMWAGF